MKRLSYLLLPTAYVTAAIGAFALGVHHHNQRQIAMIDRPLVQASRGNWFREAQSDGGIQRAPGTRTVADDNLADVFQSDSPYGTFQNVYQLLKDQYVEGVPSDTPLAYGAAQAMLASLDEPNSRYIEPSERTAIDQQDKGIYPGSGIVFTVRKAMDGDLLTRKITVIDIIPGSPADKAGIKNGDVITTVNGHWVIGYDPFQADEKIYKKLGRDEVSLEKAYTATEDKIKDGLTLAKAQTALDVPGTAPLTLILDRLGAAKPLSVTLDVSTPTQVDSVASKTLADGKGYIRFYTFDDRTVAQFDKALGSLSTATGIVIDLRNCPGGQIAPAIAIANSLAPGVEFGRIQVRDPHAKVTDASLGFGTHVQALKADASAPTLSNSYHGSFIVLVNKATANTAEMFASFLHDHLGARIVGTSTFGDGLAQSLFPMTDGSAFTLTTGALQTDAGKPFNMVGITPDVPLADAAVSDTNDVALAKADSLLSLPPLKVGAVAPSSPASVSL